MDNKYMKNKNNNKCVWTIWSSSKPFTAKNGIVESPKKTRGLINSNGVAFQFLNHIHLDGVCALYKEDR